jgi:hypothetical protein
MLHLNHLHDERRGKFFSYKQTFNSRHPIKAGLFAISPKQEDAAAIPDATNINVNLLFSCCKIDRY